MNFDILRPPNIETNLATSQKGKAYMAMGIQWGDEGKGKGVHYLVEKLNTRICLRFAGGGNSAHTIIPIPNFKIALNHMPCGAAHKNGIPCLGKGMVIDPKALIEKEIKTLRRIGFLQDPSLPLIDELAHVVMPWHFILDDPTGKIGTTKRGIGPAYADKYARRGIRMVDLLHAGDLQTKIEEALDFHNIYFKHYELTTLEANPIVDKFMKFGEQLRPNIINLNEYLLNALKNGHDILGEGNQGVEIGVNSIEYPFVTSSDTSVGTFSTGSGVPPQYIDRIFGIIKPYGTSVGKHPGFITEENDIVSTKLRKVGGEFGAATGRPRNCGWLDVLATQKAIEQNGISHIIMSKLDVLSGFGKIKTCIGYEIDGKRINHLPIDFATRSNVKPIYEKHSGWRKNISGIQKFALLPKNAQRFINKLETQFGIPIIGIGTGPNTEDFIWRE